MKNVFACRAYKSQKKVENLEEWFAQNKLNTSAPRK